MLARAISYAILGLDAFPVEVEVDAAPGLPSLSIIGLPDQVVREARERVRSAIVNSQYHLPGRRLTVNLAPADLKKEGGVFDLAIALAVLAASGQLDPAALAGVAVLGELALDGTVRPVPGVLPVALALRHGARRLVLPLANAHEAAAVQGIDPVPVGSLAEAVAVISDAQPPRRTAAPHPQVAEAAGGDFAEVKGQAHAKRALEVAVAGGHHVLLIGPPGSGKTMLAQRVPGIQPPLTYDEAIDVTRIYSVAGLLNGTPLLGTRPFRAPHHTSSAAALIGGGALLKPGEASLAHHGVLFLDELPEFHRDALEGLRQPLESGSVAVARTKRSLAWPARFMLVAAMNPCPCGHLTDGARRCRCSATQVHQYMGRVSGPLLDRIDLHIDVPAVPFDALTRAPAGESSADIRARVIAAQDARRRRGQALPNAQLGAKDMKAFCPLGEEALRLLKGAMQELHLSARSYAKVLRIARTAADLAGVPHIEPAHVAEAIQYRSLDRDLFR